MPDEAQLQGIFVNCTITNWNQVGGNNAPIKIYTVLPQYGTRKAWDTFLGGSSSSCRREAIDQTDNSEIAAADLTDAIVPGLGRLLERAVQAQARPARHRATIDGVTPTLTNIAERLASRSRRFLYNVFCAGDPTKATSAARAAQAAAATRRYIGFNGWICKAGTSGTPSTRSPVPTTAPRSPTPSRQYGFAPLPMGATGGGTTITNYCRLARPDHR